MPTNHMNQPIRRQNLLMILIALTVISGVLLACARMLNVENTGYFSVSGTGQAPVLPGNSEQNPGQPPKTPGGPIQSPTPDDPHQLPSARREAEEYVVQAGDTVGIIAQKYNLSIDLIAQANNMTNPNLLDVGQVLVIPVATPEGIGTDFKIIPDSELVYGPGTTDFNIEEFIQSQAGYLATYSEEVNGQNLKGAAILRLVAQNYSVNPRLLLAVLEHQSGWVTQVEPAQETRKFPIGVRNPERKGLYRELAWTANTLNHGFYSWRINSVGTWVLPDNSVIPVADTINAGTAGVQYMYAQLYNTSEWTQAVTSEGLFATYNRLFGYPFYYAVEPLLPNNLEQPELQLPFETGKIWAFTGGPHGGWDSGSAWAAIDFAPPGDALGCVPSNDWVVAVADGAVLRTGEGQVIQELDGDGYEQTGWVILYMHIESKDRVLPGTYFKAGERIGHPSCEGGFSSGTHVHLARKYNGEWIPADQDLPFVLDGWVSSGNGNEYDGFLVRGRKSIEAYAGRNETNIIGR